jgi:uncharacterized protein
MARHRKIPIVLALPLCISLALTPAHATSPSFSCAKARLPDEVAICHSPALSRLDHRMSSLYHDITACSGMGVRGDMQDDQRAWIKSRQDCGANAACITKLYKKRIGTWEPKAGPYRAARKANNCPI